MGHYLKGASHDLILVLVASLLFGIVFSLPASAREQGGQYQNVPPEERPKLIEMFRRTETCKNITGFSQPTLP